MGAGHEQKVAYSKLLQKTIKCYLEDFGLAKEHGSEVFSCKLNHETDFWFKGFTSDETAIVSLQFFNTSSHILELREVNFLNIQHSNSKSGEKL